MLRRVQAEKTIRETVNELFNQMNVDERQELIKFTFSLDQKLWIIALNNILGLGQMRIERVLQEISELYTEFEERQRTVDTIYANYVLERRVRQIMGKDFFSRKGLNDD